MADKPAKLSQAIRLGATFRPQCTGSYMYAGGSCAWGAAMEAVFGEDQSRMMLKREKLESMFGISRSLSEQIAHRNDSGQTRESIADWLESIGY